MEKDGNAILMFLQFFTRGTGFWKTRSLWLLPKQRPAPAQGLLAVSQLAPAATHIVPLGLAHMNEWQVKKAGKRTEVQCLRETTLQPRHRAATFLWSVHV